MWQLEIGTRVQHINPACIKEYGVIVDRKYDHKGQPYYRVKCDDGSHFNEHNPSYLLPCTNIEGANRQVIEQEAPSKTKSNGGSSDYYKLEINGNPVEVEDILTIVDDSNDAASILQQAKDCLVNRGVERDKPNGERSMKSTVEAFNALTGYSLSESAGWLFMLCLKAARAEGGCFKADDYVDGAAYFALYGEAAAKEANND